MSKFLFTWEMGDDLGHVTSIAPLADALVARGHEVYLAVKEIDHLSRLIDMDHIRFLQAPISSNVIRSDIPLNNMAEILMTRPFQSSDVLTSLIAGWRTLFELIQPDVVLLDYSPVAALTCHVLNQKRMTYSSGFFEATQQSTNIDLTPWVLKSTPRAENAEKRLLNVANNALNRLGLPAITSMASLYQADHAFILGIPELDIYADQRIKADYCAIGVPPTDFAEPRWMGDNKKKIFAYLKGRYPLSKRLLFALTKTDAQVCAVCTGITEDEAQRFTGDNLYVTHQPIQLTHALANADLIMCHGGKGLVTQSLLAGKPLLINPTQLEQANTAYRVTQQRLGQVVQAKTDEKTILHQIDQLLHQPEYQRNAEQLRQKYREHPSLLNVQQILEQLEKMV